MSQSAGLHRAAVAGEGWLLPSRASRGVAPAITAAAEAKAPGTARLGPSPSTRLPPPPRAASLSSVAESEAHTTKQHQEQHMVGAVDEVGSGGAESPGAIPQDRLYVRFNEQWYDLTKWAAKHPAGSHWIEHFNGRDGTEVFHAFHSEQASAILGRMQPLKDQKLAQALSKGAPPSSRLTQQFRKLREKLQKEGWFKRNPWMEAYQLSTWAFFTISGIAMCHSGSELLRTLACVPLALSLVDCCWLAHDYIHGRGRWCSTMRHFGGWAGGFGATMWSEKHNMHHASTNEMGVDEDLSGGPLMWLWAPDPKNDKPWRKYQHMYCAFLFSLLHVVWRVDSLKVVKSRGLWLEEGLPILVHYVVALALIPWQTYVAAMLLGGFILANVVTCTHQSEDLVEPGQTDWVDAQFRTTRDAVTMSPLNEWLWGGMQYQLPHHLFPTMPRYNYPKLRPLLEKWAKDNGVEYRQAGELRMFAQNYENYKRVAALEAVPGALASKSGSTI